MFEERPKKQLTQNISRRLKSSVALQMYAFEVARLTHGKNVLRGIRRQFSSCANKRIDKQQPTISIFEVGLASIISSLRGFSI